MVDIYYICRKEHAMKEDIYALSNREIAADIGKRLRAYRKRMGLTRKALSEKSGVSDFTIGTFERGDNPGLSLISLLALMRSIEQLDQIADLLPELPVSPKELFEQERNKSRK